LLPIAPICAECDVAFTLGDISELDVDEISTVLGLEFNCWDWPNGAVACNTTELAIQHWKSYLHNQIKAGRDQD